MPVKMEKPYRMVGGVRRLQPAECKGLAELLGRLFVEHTDELPQSEVYLGMDGRIGGHAADVQNLNSVIIRKAVAFEPEEKALDDPGCCSINTLSVEFD